MQSDPAHSAHSIHFRLTFIVVTRYPSYDTSGSEMGLGNGMVVWLRSRSCSTTLNLQSRSASTETLENGPLPGDDNKREPDMD